MAHPAYIRDKAVWMRVERRMTLDEIAEHLALGKTIVWYWIKDLEVEPELRVDCDGSTLRAAAARRGNARMQEKYAALRHAAYRDGLREFDELCQEPGFRDFVCMYLGEGYKKNRNRVSIANSDPHVIDLANLWLRRLVDDKRITYSVQYHADQDLDRLRRFWAFRVGVEPQQIKLQRKSNSNQLKGRNWRSRWGVLSVSVNDTYLRARLEAWIHRLTDSWLDSVVDGV
jgi:hypothetical protein